MITRLIKLTATALLGVSLMAGCGNKDAQSDSAASPPEPTIPVVKVKSEMLERKIVLPAELRAYQDIELFPKVDGFIKYIGVDRGSRVTQGQTIIRITAPEFEAKCQEAESKVKAAHSTLLQAQSKLQTALAEVRQAQAKRDAVAVTNARLRDAAKEPGVISDNEVDVSNKDLIAADEGVHAKEQAAEAARSDLAAAKENLGAAQKSLQSLNDMRAYLTINAPFTGMITTRTVHEGSFVSPVGHSDAMVRLQQLDHLRLVVPIPEIAFSGVHDGMTIYFTVPAYPGKMFSGIVRRVSHMLDQKTRTMPIEADVYTNGELAPGMFPDVQWASSRTDKPLFVPATAVATNLERTYLLKIKDGVAYPTEVERGQPMGDMVEVFGDIAEGDEVALKARDDLKTGAKVIAKPADDADFAAVKPKTD